jgi:hypothetical protein
VVDDRCRGTDLEDDMGRTVAVADMVMWDMLKVVGMV